MHDEPQTKWQARTEFGVILIMSLLFTFVWIWIEGFWLAMRYRKTTAAICVLIIAYWGLSWVGLVG